MFSSRFLLVAAVCGLVAGEQDGTLKFLVKSVERCGGWEELGSCLRLKALRLLDRAIASGPLKLDDQITLTPESGTPIQQQSEEELVANLPRGAGAKEAALDQLLADRLYTFMSTRSIKFNLLPQDEAENGIEESRGKKNKKGGGMMIVAMMGAMMVKVALAKLALLAGKALIVSKMALVLASIIGLKKLVGGGGGHETQVIYAGGHEGGGGGGDWGRTGPELAYSAHAH